MVFSIPPRAASFLPTVNDFVRSELQAIELDALREGIHSQNSQLEALRAKVKDLGLWAPHAPKELGRMGLTLVEHGLMSEALGHSPIGHYVFGCQAPDAGNSEILHTFGTEEQKERWLSPLCAGEIRSCFSMTEPNNAGSNPTKMSTTATLDGDDWFGSEW